MRAHMHTMRAHIHNALLFRLSQGTPKRGEQVAAYVRTRTLDEVLLMVKERQGMSSTRVNKSEDFKAGQKKRAEVTSAVRRFGGGREGVWVEEVTLAVGRIGGGRDVCVLKRVTSVVAGMCVC